MLRQVRDILSVLDEKLRTRFYVISLMSLFSPVLDLFSLSRLFPILEEAASGGPAGLAAVKLLLLGLLMIFKGAYELLLAKLQASWQCDCNWVLAVRMYDLILKEDLPRHNSKNESQVLHHVRRDVGETVLVLVYFKEILLNGILLAGYACLMIVQAGVLGALCALLFAAVLLLPRKLTAKKTLAYGNEVRRREIELAGMTAGAYHAYKEAAIDDRKDRLTERFSENLKRKETVTKAYLLQQSLTSVMLQTFLNTAVFVSLAIILMSGVNTGVLFSVIVLLITVLTKMLPVAKKILTNGNHINFSRKSYEDTMDNCRRCRAILEKTRSEEESRYRPLSLKKAVSVRGVTFAYPGGPAILEHVDMEIPAGKTVALIGPSGMGKTTLLDLIVGLLRPEEGAILYDDYDIVKNEDSLGRCRTNMGEAVSYMPQLLAGYEGTVKECVAFLDPPDQIDESRVVECLKTSMLYEDVERMPRGIHTVIGAQGVRLSGGQYQRLGLARALYKNAELLVMDEGTASLDTGAETAVFQAVKRERKEKTLLLATHHQHLADQCDMIYEVSERRVIRRK